MKGLIGWFIAVLLFGQGLANASILHDAVQSGERAKVQALLNAGINIDAKDRAGWTALHYASINDHLQLVKDLIKARVHVNERDRMGLTALHWAADNGNLAIVEELIKADANVNATDESGNTPLHLASIGGHASTVLALLWADADVNVKNRKTTKTAIEYVMRHGHAEILDLIKNWSIANRKRITGTPDLEILNRFSSLSYDQEYDDYGERLKKFIEGSIEIPRPHPLGIVFNYLGLLSLKSLNTGSEMEL